MFRKKPLNSAILNVPTLSIMMIVGLSACNNASNSADSITENQPKGTAHNSDTVEANHADQPVDIKMNTKAVSDAGIPQANDGAAVNVTAINTEPVESKPSLQQVLATVYKEETCGCCDGWVEHVQQHGLTADVVASDDMAIIKTEHGVPDDMRSCHTTVTEAGYVFEGHIPARFMAQFLANPPADALGLVVPGMPVGSPGMEYQDKYVPYDVMQINKDGSTQVYASVQSLDDQV